MEYSTSIAYFRDEAAFLFHSWYLGYVLAAVCVIITAFGAGMTVRKRCDFGRIHCILWLPALIMLFINVIISRIDVPQFISNVVEVHKNYLAIHGLQESVSDAAVMKTLVRESTRLIETFFIQRWLDNSWRYVLAALAMSAVAFLIMLGAGAVSRVKVTGICALILAALTVFCAIDRANAYSARLIFEHNTGGEKTEIDPQRNRYFYLDENGELVWRRVIAGSSMDGGLYPYDEMAKYILAEDVPVYAEPSSCSEKICVLKKGKQVSLYWLQSLIVSDSAGWREGDNFPNEPYYDEKGYPHYRYRGYMRINDLIAACGSKEENGLLGVMARAFLMDTDVGSFVEGYDVSPSIMYAFIPFELYLLYPFTALSIICWVVLLIRKRRGA